MFYLICKALVIEKKGKIKFSFADKTREGQEIETSHRQEERQLAK